MSQEAANKFVWTMTWKTQPDWYKQLKEKGCTTEELIRAAAENGYGEFTEEEYNESRRKSQDLMRQMLG